MSDDDVLHLLEIVVAIVLGVFAFWYREQRDAARDAAEHADRVRDNATAERDKARGEREEAIADRDAERSRSEAAMLELARMTDQRDAARAERETAMLALATATAERDAERHRLSTRPSLHVASPTFQFEVGTGDIEFVVEVSNHAGIVAPRIVLGAYCGATLVGKMVSRRDILPWKSINWTVPLTGAQLASLATSADTFEEDLYIFAQCEGLPESRVWHGDREAPDWEEPDWARAADR